MTLTEAIAKPFLSRKKEDENNDLSSIPPEEKEKLSVYDSSDPDVIATGFFDNTASLNMGMFDKPTVLKKQADYIRTYRTIANYPEVDEAITEIVNEAIFNPDTQYDSVAINFTQDSEIPQGIQDKISEEFRSILSKLNLDKNFYNFFYNYYVDGQIVFHVSYKEKNKDIGFATIKTLDPINLYYDMSSHKWKYEDTFEGPLYSRRQDNSKANLTFDKEEIIRIDSGIFSDKIILSNLHKAIRPANLLKTMEDMLIPMRFARSMSRRVFNVDVANLPENKVKQVMDTYKTTYKYSNFFNIDAGTISKQSHINSLVEDYWFPNRGGARGTSVDTIDETGNLGEIKDIIYLKQKLYVSLQVPVSRMSDSESTPEFDFNSTSISRDEMKFFAKISRLRTQFSEVFYELLRRQLIFKKVINESEWRTIQKDIFVKYSNQNVFYEKLEQERMSSRFAIFSSIREDVGKIYSWEYALKNILKMSDDEVISQSKQIEKEKKDPIYKRFYETQDEE